MRLFAAILNQVFSDKKENRTTLTGIEISEKKTTSYGSSR